LGTLIRRGLRLLFRHRLGPFFLALILLVIGVTIGLTSHQVTYQRLEHVKILHYLSGSGANKADLPDYLFGLGDNTAYIQLEDHSLYVLKLSEFTPTLNVDSLQSPMSTLIYESQDTEEIDVSATNTQTHLVGNGAQVVQLISYGADGSAKTFNSTEYMQNPQGFYRNNWSFGAYFIVAGLILGFVLFFFARHRLSGSTETMPVPTVYAAPRTKASVAQPANPQQLASATQWGPISQVGFQTPYQQSIAQQGPVSQPGFQALYQQPAPQQGPVSQPGFQALYQQPAPQQFNFPPIRPQEQQLEFPQEQQLEFPQYPQPQVIPQSQAEQQGAIVSQGATRPYRE
jgi:hypothetical protein